MQLNTAVASDVQVSPECLFLPADAGLFVTDSDLNFETQDMRELAAQCLVLMGLSEVLKPGGESPDDIIAKPHEKVVGRDAAVTEQFYHPDVAVNGFCGIFLIGLEGADDTSPETQAINNEAMVEHIDHFVQDGPLQDRFDDIVVVRPYFDTEDRSEWMDLPRHSLMRLGSQFDDLLSAEQLAHVNRERKKVTDTSKYIGDVFVSKLRTDSVIDGSPLLTCGVAQRELRLSLGADESKEETEALRSLHDEITRYLLDPSSPYGTQKIVEGSALFVPKDQLHRATPYLPHYRRSIVGVRCYAQPGQTAPTSWQRASGTEY